MRRARITCVALVLASVLSAEDAPAGLRFNLVPLSPSIPGNALALVNDINDAGVAVGKSTPAPNWNLYSNDSRDRATSWALDGTATTLAVPLLPFGQSSGTGAAAINESGQVVGYAASSSVQPLIYASNGVPTVLTSTTSPGEFSEINDAGVAIGRSNYKPIIYSSGTVRTLDSIGNASAEAISADGTAYGFINSSRQTAARLRENDSPVALTTGDSFSAVSGVTAINRRNVAVGFYRPSDSSVPRAVTWKNGVRTILTADWAEDQPSMVGRGKVGHIATGTNDQDWIVGTQSWLYSSRMNGTAFLIRPGERDLLEDLIAGEFADRVRLTWASAVNNRGQIVADGSYDHDNNPATAFVSAAFRLDPIRTPGDTNADDRVDFDDLLTLAQHYGQGGNGNVFYETGDFNYDWQVGFDDLLTLAQHYDRPASFAGDWALAVAMVPEPTTAVGVGIATLAFRRRRCD